MPMSTMATSRKQSKITITLKKRRCVDIYCANIFFIFFTFTIDYLFYFFYSPPSIMTSSFLFLDFINFLASLFVRTYNFVSEMFLCLRSIDLIHYCTDGTSIYNVITIFITTDSFLLLLLVLVIGSIFLFFSSRWHRVVDFVKGCPCACPCHVTPMTAPSFTSLW